jgi:peptidoglycan hydrolase-like protein with peptidoglycan-binding domain
MKIALEKDVSLQQTRLTEEEEWTVRQIKIALNRLGFYLPDKNKGITGEIEDNFRKSLQAFQMAHAIPGDDIPGPGSLTERILNEELQRGEVTQFYTWRTVGDSKVRGAHAARRGLIFSWNDSPEGGHPGEDYHCRCWAEPYPPPPGIWADDARKRQEDAEILQKINTAAVVFEGIVVSVELCLRNSRCRNWLMGQTAKIVLENHIPPPDTLPAFPDAKPAPRRGQRARWKDSKGKIYEWDSKKGEVEIYDKTGKKHEGGFDPKTGKQISKPVPGRKTEK